MHTYGDYLNWIKRKFSISKLERNIEIKEGEVYWCSLGLNIGDEENGKGAYHRRPVLVFKKFNNNIFWGIPLSTKNKENKYYIPVLLKDEIVSAMVSQLRVIDTKRLDKEIGYIAAQDFKRVKESIRNIIN